MPAGAPVAEDVNYVELGKRFELGPSSIQAAVQRACAEAAYRGSQRLREVDGAGTMPAGNEVEFGAHVTPYAEERVRMADLHAAGDIEVIKLRDQYFEVTSRMFT